MRVVSRNGVPDSVNTYSPLKKLTINQGIRFDVIKSDAAATCVDAARLPRRITVVATVIEPVATRLNRIEDF